MLICCMWTVDLPSLSGNIDHLRSQLSEAMLVPLIQCFNSLKVFSSASKCWHLQYVHSISVDIKVLTLLSTHCSWELITSSTGTFSIVVFCTDYLKASKLIFYFDPDQYGSLLKKSFFLSTNLKDDSNWNISTWIRRQERYKLALEIVLNHSHFTCMKLACLSDTNAGSEDIKLGAL
jgi:hypothetical protein